MNSNTWLTYGTKILNDSSVATARLDCLVLLEDCLGKDRAWLLAHPQLEITTEQEGILQAQLERRAAHEPLAYIRGKTEFYGREFIIEPCVLVPRPESENIIETLKKYVKPGDSVADIGTGSGALAITAALETDAVVAAVDIDEACLDVAKRNAVLHTASVLCLQSDLLEVFVRTNDAPEPTILLCNLPYVPDNFAINTAAEHEPGLALFGGEDGLDLYRRLFAQATQITNQPAYILTEALPEQHDTLTQIAVDHGYQLVETNDFIQAFQLS